MRESVRVKRIESFIAESVPRKRIGTAEDIVGLCIYLCSRAGAYTVGDTITCDGGIVNASSSNWTD